MWATIPILRMRSLGNGGTADLARPSVQVAAPVAVGSTPRPVGFGLGFDPLTLLLERADDSFHRRDTNVVDRAEEQHALPQERRVRVEPVAKRVDELSR